MKRVAMLAVVAQLALGCSSAATSDGGAGAGGTAMSVAGSPTSAGGGSTAAGTGGASVGGGGASSAGGGNGGASSAGSAGMASGGTGGAVGLTGTVQIMVVGSSNELGTCWRAFLWQKLHAAEISNFDFVGGVVGGPDCNVAGYDKDVQAQSGIIISDLPASTYAGWFGAHPPDIILMHFGGADLLSNKPIDGVMKAYSLALAQARIVNPKVRLLIGEHTPQGGADCAKCLSDVKELNADIAAWAPVNSTPESPVTAVDLFTGIDSATDLSDGTHLNESGSTKVADKWFALLKPLFKP